MEAALHGLDKPEFCSFGAVGRWLHWGLKFLFCKVRRRGGDKIFKMHFSAFIVWFYDFEMEWLGRGQTVWWPTAERQPHLLSLALFHCIKRHFHLKTFKHQRIILIYLDGFEDTVRRQHCTVFFLSIYFKSMKLRFGSRATFSPITLEQLLSCFSASVFVPCVTGVFCTCLTGLLIRLKLSVKHHGRSRHEHSVFVHSVCHNRMP